jgi:hypothetical protein
LGKPTADSASPSGGHMRDDRLVSTVVGWEQPPKHREVMYDWDAIAVQLRARPGQWAKVFDWDRTSVANAIRQGSVKALRAEDGFETRTRNNTRQPVRMCTLFMRYNPDADRSNHTKKKRKKG